jgi:hypothetical protein
MFNYLFIYYHIILQSILLLGVKKHDQNEDTQANLSYCLNKKEQGS